jgi:hypothetical protein
MTQAWIPTNFVVCEDNIRDFFLNVVHFEDTILPLGYFDDVTDIRMELEYRHTNSFENALIERFTSVYDLCDDVFSAIHVFRKDVVQHFRFAKIESFKNE